MINIKLNLLQIPKERIFSGEKGKYLDLVVAEMQNTDNYGNTHTVYVAQTNQEREQRAAKVYIGKGKEVTFENKPQGQYTTPSGASTSDTSVSPETMGTISDFRDAPEPMDDLPF